MKNYEHQRGAILVESALVVGAIFLMLFGTVFLAIIGFDQMSADGASYEVAHQTSVGASAPPAAAAHGVFPNIPQSGITTAVQPAPQASIAVDYGYNSSNFQTYQGSVNNRHGGVSMMQGTMVVGSANKSSAKILGMPISVVGSMVEPMWLENGLHFDAENANNYGGTTPVCAPTAAPTGSGTPPPARCFQGNVFQVGENTPPYYVGFNYMAHCTHRQLPWGTTYNSNGATCDDTGTNGLQFTPLGVAEFLDFSNWCDATSPSSCPATPANPGVAGSKQSDATFATIACHQRLYVTIANYLQTYSTVIKVYQHEDNGNDGYSDANTAGPYFYYSNRQIAGRASNSFTVWEGFDTPKGSEDIVSDQNAASPVDAAVRQIYHFDGHDVDGPSGSSNALNPGYGC